MNWDESMFYFEETCTGDPDMESDWEDVAYLTEDGIEYAKAVLELRGLSGAEIADLESAIEGDYIDDGRIKTIFQNHASELL